MEKRYDHNNLQINTETQSPVGFAVNETIPDESWHFSVLCRKYVHDNTRNLELSSKWISQEGNLTKGQKTRVSELVGDCWRMFQGG